MAQKNDWIVANINNPNLDTYDLITLGDMNTKNTQFLKEEDYLKSNFIKNNKAFKDENGNFSQAKFDTFYKQQAVRWGEFQEDTFPKGLELDYFDTDRVRNKNARVKDMNFRLGTEYDPANGRFGNPDQVQMGIEGWNTVSDRTKSEKEIAQSQKIYDPATKKFLNETPEDSALFSNPVKFIKSLFEDPLVLAVYDKDEIDEFGIQHKKGEKKLNDQGTYYYEKLNGRSPMNREVLSLGDILTKEDSVLNKIDFMDSDDLEKSTAGVIAKNIAYIAPMFIPGVGPYYYKALVAKEMVRAMPMLYSVGTNLFSSNNNEPPAWMNTLAAKGESFTSGHSVYSSEHPFSFENFANLISDVALQWGQQKEIAKAVQSLGGGKSKLAEAEKRAKALFDLKSTGKLASMAEIDPALVKAGLAANDAWKTTTLGQLCLEQAYKPVQEALQKKARFGADLALAYMAIVSNTDVYADMKDRGLTNREAAWITLGSTIGMFSVDKFTKIGEMFYDDLTPGSIKEGRQILKKEFQEAANNIYKNGTKETSQTLFNKGLNLGKKMGSKLGEFWEGVQFHDLGFVGKAVGEGLEEVSEELVTDLAKEFYQLAGQLGANTTTTDVGAFENMLDRYAMSFLGGSMGGGLFYGVEKFQNRFNKRQDRELVDLIRDGKANELRDLVVKYRQQGKVGSTELSGLDYVRNPESSTVTWLNTDQQDRSQNSLIAQKVIDKINSLEATIVGNNANLSDDELFDRMVLKEARYQQYKNASHVTGYYQDFKNRLDKLIAAESALKAATDTLDGNPGSNPANTDAANRNNPLQNIKDRNLQTLQEGVTNAKKELDDFLSGDTALEYTRKLNFILDPVLNSAFLGLNYNEWMNQHLDIDPEDPTTFDQQKIIEAQKGWQDHVKEVMSSEQVNKGFAAYIMLEKSLVNPLMQQQEVAQTYGQTLTALNQLYELNPEQNGFALSFSEYMQAHKPYTFDSRLVDENGVEEDEDTWKARLLTGTPDFELARVKRMQRVADLNRQIFQDYINQFEAILQPINYQIDSASARNLVQNIQNRIQDVISVESKYAKIDSTTGSIFDTGKYSDLITKLKDDLSNKDEVQQLLLNRYYSEVSQEAAKVISTIGMTEGLDRTIKIDLSDLSLRTIKDQLADMNDDDVHAVIDIINNLATTNPYIQSYVATNPINTKDDYLKLIEYLKGAATREINRLENADEEDGSVEEILAGISEVNKPLVEQYLSSNEVKSYEDIHALSKYLRQQINDETLAHILPQEISTAPAKLTDIFNKFARVFYVDTIQQVIKALRDLNSSEFKYLNSLNPELPKLFSDTLDSMPMSFGKDVSISVLAGNPITAETQSPTIQKQAAAVQRYLNDTIKRIQTNPIYAFYQKLQVSVHSPLEQLLSQVATTLLPEGETININALLDSIYKSYVTADSKEAFVLEDTQAKNLDIAKKSMEMVSAFIYAASTTPDGTHYFGQNKQINEFAATHKKDLIKEWQPLPEIDDKYATLLQQEQTKLYKEIQLWKIISDINTMNKLGRLVDTESVLNRLRYNALKGISYKFSIDGKEYDLMEGVDSLPDFTENKPDQLNQLFEVEQAIHDNFQKALADSSKTAEELFEDGTFFQSIIHSPTDIKLQKVSLLQKNMTEISDFDKALYVLSLLSDNPSDYFRSVKNQIELNSRLAEEKQIAPLTVQQNLSRLAEAAHSKTYKAGFKALAQQYKTQRTITPNIVHIDGAAGAGKTEVVLKAVRQRFKDEDALIIGPTTSQASKLQLSLGEATSYTFDPQDSNNIFKLLLGDPWRQISQDINSAVVKLNELINSPQVQKDLEANNPVEERVSTDYFDLVYYAKGQEMGTRVELKTDKLNFNDEFKQTLVLVDEAAHMNAVQAAILDAYAEKVGGTVYLASDSNQSGYFKYPLENIGPTSLFCTRTSKLTESLRSSNIQMQENGNKIAGLLDTTEAVFNYGDDAAQKEWLQRLPVEISKLNLRVYDEKDDINGYKIGADQATVIQQLKAIQDAKQAKGENISIGFIGDKGSTLYQAMTDAGIKLSDPLTETPKPGKKFMQGQEFDYVVIDNMENIPKTLTPDYQITVGFLKRFYTLATRGKVASIFMDDISNLVGVNTKDTQKSIGFNITKQVSLFRDNYLEALNKLQLRDSEEVEKPKPKEVPTEQPKEKTHIDEEGKKVITIENPTDSPETDPEKTNTDLEQKANEVLVSMETLLDDQPEDKQTDSDVVDYNETQTSLNIEANTVMPIIGLVSKQINDNPFPTWLPYDPNLVYKDAQGNVIRRNLQCFVTTANAPDGIYEYKEKQKFQNLLHSIQSFVLFGGELPNIGNYIKNVDWSKMRLQVEIRPKADTDIYGVGTDLQNTFIKKGGQTYVMAVVCRLDDVIDHDTGARYSAIFDICQLSDPSLLDTKTRQNKITKNIENKVQQLKIKLAKGGLTPGQEQAIRDQIKNAQDFAKNLPTAASRYNALIEEVLANSPEGKTIELPVNKYTLHRISRLVKRNTPRRLGTHIDISNIENNVRHKDGPHKGEYIQNFDSFMDQDTRKVVSDVYIVGNKSDVLKGVIDESIFGKAVIFVSNNTNLDKDKLPELYIEQKLHPESHTAEVRMVVLNNHGLSFSELVHNRVREELSSLAGTKTHKPWRMDVLGVRMYTAMWNWRASLYNFNEALNKWKADKNYSTSKVNRIVEAEKDLFDKAKAQGTTVETLAKQVNYEYDNGLSGEDRVTIEDIRNLIEFNQEYCKDIPIFRLGVDVTKDSKGRHYGGYIRLFNVKSDSKVYKNKKIVDPETGAIKTGVNLFVIDQEHATLFYNVLNVILNQLTTTPDGWKGMGGNKPLKSLNTRLRHTDGSDFKVNEYIGKDEQHRNLSGLIHTEDKVLVLGETDNEGKVTKTIEIAPESIFSFFPKAIVAIAAKTLKYQASDHRYGVVQISTVKSNEGTDEKDYFNFDVAELFGKGLLDPDAKVDNTLFNLFDLMFHGTTQSLEQWKQPRTGRLKRAYLEDAFAKYGFFVDPDLEYSNEYKEINIHPTGSGQNFTFLKCGTSPAYFDVDVDVIPGGLSLDLDYLEKAFRGQTTKEEQKDPKQNEGEGELDEISGFAATLTDETEREAFFDATENEPGIENNEDGYKEWKRREKVKSLQRILIDGRTENADLSVINNQLKEQGINTEIQAIIEKDGIYTYTDTDGKTGTISLEIEGKLCKIKLNPTGGNSGVGTTGDFDTVIQNSLHNDVMDSNEFRDILSENFEDEDIVSQLFDFDDFQKYLAFIKDSENNKLIRNLIRTITDNDTKNKLLDYLTAIKNLC